MKVERKVIAEAGKAYRYMCRKWHVVAIVSDEGEEVVVIKTWARSKLRWLYEAMPRWLFEHFAEKA